MATQITGRGRIRGVGSSRAGAAVALLAEPAAALAVFVLYARTLSYAFVFDDLSLIGPRGPLALGGAILPYRPLRYLSYLLDDAIGGGAPWAYHATNVLLHALAAVVVVRLARRLRIGFPAALAAGVLFAVHPVAVEAVAYVAGRRDLLSNLLGLVALLCWVHPSRGRTVAAVAAVILAVAAKETGILFVPVLALASAAGLGPRLRSAAPVLAWALLAALALPVAYGARGPVLFAERAWARLAASAELAAHYAGSMAFPVALAVDYPHLHHAGADGLSGASVLAGLGVIATATAVLLAFASAGAGAGASGAGQARRRRYFVPAWLAMFTLAVAGVVGMHEPGADRHAYLLLAPLALGLAAGAQCLLATRAAPVAVAVVLACVAGAAGLSDRRIPLWHNQWSLWSTTVAQAPDSARAQHNLAGLLFAQGAYSHAREHLRAAIRADPGLAASKLGLAAILCAQGRRFRAQRKLARARVMGMAEAEVAAVERSCTAAEQQP